MYLLGLYPTFHTPAQSIQSAPFFPPFPPTVKPEKDWLSEFMVFLCVFLFLSAAWWMVIMLWQQWKSFETDFTFPFYKITLWGWWAEQRKHMKPFWKFCCVILLSSPSSLKIALCLVPGCLILIIWFRSCTDKLRCRVVMMFWRLYLSWSDLVTIHSSRNDWPLPYISFSFAWFQHFKTGLGRLPLLATPDTIVIAIWTPALLTHEYGYGQQLLPVIFVAHKLALSCGTLLWNCCQDKFKVDANERVTATVSKSKILTSPGRGIR